MNSRGSSATDSSGGTRTGMLVSIEPMICMFPAAKSIQRPATRASAKTTIVPGNRASQTRSAARTPTNARPSTSVGQCVSGSRLIHSKSRRSMLSSSKWMLQSLPSWLAMMTMAAPFMKPSITGLDRKSAAAPSRSQAASSRIPATSNASQADTATALPGSPSDSGPMAAPTMMAIAASGPTITCREPVNNAKATIAPRAAYSPAIGGHFARSA